MVHSEEKLKGNYGKRICHFSQNSENEFYQVRFLSACKLLQVWLRSRCPKGLTAQMKGENLMVVPETADDFRAAVSALRSLGVSKGVSFHTFSLPEDCCARLLIKNLGRRMHEDVVREELEDLGICVQGVMQLRSGAVTRTLRRTAQ